MHALCTILAKKPNYIDEILEDYCYNDETGEGEWDYAVIGGRYEGIIPLKNNAKALIDRPPLIAPRYIQEYNVDRFVSIAKNRTIDVETMTNILNNDIISPLNPYRLLIPDLGIDIVGIEPRDRRVNEMITKYILEHPTHVMAVVDYHY